MGAVAWNVWTRRVRPRGGGVESVNRARGARVGKWSAWRLGAKERLTSDSFVDAVPRVRGDDATTRGGGVDVGGGARGERAGARG